MVKKIVITFLFFSSIAYGQTNEEKARIKFIDGSVFYVVIIENQPGQYVRFSLPSNDDITIKYNNILSIKHRDFSYFSRYINTKGFFMEVSTSVMFGKAAEQDGPQVGFGLGMSANYQLNSHVSVGVGAEPTAILITNENFLMPFYSRLKYTILERKVSPVLIFDMGWSLVLASNEEGDFVSTAYNGGWYMKPALGFQVNNFTLSIGYQLQKTITTKSHNPWWTAGMTTVEERTMKNISISSSFRF